MCHVCLPSPCLNGGVCGHPHAWAFTCNCTGTGYTGDICQLHDSDIVEEADRSELTCASLFGAESAVQLLAIDTFGPQDLQVHACFRCCKLPRQLA